ncbi:uncharacterized protein EDB93DRAFT_1258859 [Suillus bovinus]|uniref:uncharacterized protein n=1 Tax=Suillus bovinus TaxID=48563 RepID=UPI001B87FD53|nr:uncharacterized protein EDB93DRAFT_1258859 [Suillus bovinus]KAG2124397.1 hypothetical protein EDB93DRAFT_1258859 [Suillus bovinus]
MSLLEFLWEPRALEFLGNLEPLCSGIAWKVILVSSAFIGVWPSSMVARGIVHSFVSLVFSKPTMSLLEFLWEPRAVVLWHRVEEKHGRPLLSPVCSIAPILSALGVCVGWVSLRVGDHDHDYNQHLSTLPASWLARMYASHLDV